MTRTLLLILILAQQIMLAHSLEINRRLGGDFTNNDTACAQAETAFISPNQFHSIYCTDSMQQAGCDLEFSGSEAGQIGFIDENTTNKRFEVDFSCPEDFRLEVSYELQDYPYNIFKPLWRDDVGMSAINDVMEINELEKVSFLFTGHCRGVLLRASLNCVNAQGESDVTDQRRCVFFKFQGTLKYPLDEKDFVKPTLFPPTTTTTTTTTTIATTITTTTTTTNATTTKAKINTTILTTKIPTTLRINTTLPTINTTLSVINATYIPPTKNVTTTLSSTPLPFYRDVGIKSEVIAGIVVGVFLLLVVLIILTCCLCRYKKHKKGESQIVVGSTLATRKRSIMVRTESQIAKYNYDNSPPSTLNSRLGSSSPVPYYRSNPLDSTSQFASQFGNPSLAVSSSPPEIRVTTPDNAETSPRCSELDLMPPANFTGMTPTNYGYDADFSDYEPTIYDSPRPRQKSSITVFVRPKRSHVAAGVSGQNSGTVRPESDVSQNGDDAGPTGNFRLSIAEDDVNRNNVEYAQVVKHTRNDADDINEHEMAL